MSHVPSDMFDSVESYKNHMRKNNNFCVNCSKFFLNEHDLKNYKNKCNVCEQCGKEKHNGNCIKRNNDGNKWMKRK